MDKKIKKRIQTLNQRIQKLHQQIAGSRKQMDDPEELAGAARSVRILSDYLEQYPDALLRGKGGPGGK